MPLTSLSDHGAEWHLYLDSGRGEPPHSSLCEDAHVETESQLVPVKDVVEDTTLREVLEDEAVCSTCASRVRAHLGLYRLKPPDAEGNSSNANPTGSN